MPDNDFTCAIEKFLIIKLKDITFWKFFRVVFDNLIYFFGFHTIQIGDITIKKHLLVSNGDDFFFHCQ